MKQPEKSNSKKIVKLLPPGRKASHKVGSFDANVAIRILDNSGEIEKLVKSGNVYALDVAFALTEISDGEYASWLEVIINSAITKYPRKYLAGIKGRWMSHHDPCLSSAVLHWKFEGDHVKVLNERRKAIQSVTEPELETQKKCVMDVLNKYVNEPSLQ